MFFYFNYFFYNDNTCSCISKGGDLEDNVAPHLTLSKEKDEMKIKELENLMNWIFLELQSIDHGEIHVVFKVRDNHVALIEKVKIVKEKPLE